MEFGEFLNSLSLTDPVTTCFSIQDNLKLYPMCFFFFFSNLLKKISWRTIALQLLTHAYGI